MAPKVGLDLKTYRNTGVYGTPVWNEITIARDETVGGDKTKAEATARLSRYRQTIPGLKSRPITLNILADPAVDDFDSLRDAWVNDTLLDMAFADGAIATPGTKYWRGDYYVYGFSDGRPLDDTRTVDVEMDLGYSANVPAYTLVA